MNNLQVLVGQIADEVSIKAQSTNKKSVYKNGKVHTMNEKFKTEIKGKKKTDPERIDREKIIASLDLYLQSMTSMK